MNEDQFNTSRTKQATTAPPKRLRFSIWSTMNHFYNEPSKNIDRIVNAADGHVDDISLLDMIHNTTDMKNIQTKRIDDLNKWALLKEKCWNKKIQLLTGMELIFDNPFTNAFNDWIYGIKHQNVSIDNFAEKISSFISNLPGCGGINFDIERIHQKKIVGGDIVKAKERLTDFYRSVALKLEKSAMIVAVALPAIVDDAGHPGRNKKGDAEGVPTPQKALADYQMTFRKPTYPENLVRIPNLILRPMGYDYYTGAPGGPPRTNYIDDYHKGVIEYALNEKKVHASQFQIGVKVVKPGTGNNTPNPELLDTFEKVKNRCQGLCRKHDVGIVLFAAMSMLDDWKQINAELNNGAASPITVFEPFQMPFFGTRY